jgi:hypothetical protein
MEKIAALEVTSQLDVDLIKGILVSLLYCMLMK